MKAETNGKIKGIVAGSIPLNGALQMKIEISAGYYAGYGIAEGKFE